MHRYNKFIKLFLRKRRPNYGYCDISSLMEHLWRSYTQSNPIKSAKLDMLYDKLEPVYCDLSAQQADLLFSTICDICDEHEHISFLEGMHVGFRLAVELQEKF